MSEKFPQLGALALLSNYSGESASEDSDTDEIEEIPLTPSDIVLQIILNDILAKVVSHNVVKNIDDDEVMFIDHDPSFDVYRGRKREMSECSSVVVTDSIGHISDSSSSSSSSEESDSSDADVILAGDDDDEDDDEPRFGKKKTVILKVKGELLPSDLPPIEDLHITVPEAECFQVGTVSSCVDDLVVVQSLPGMPVLDLDSVLFLDKGQHTLGKVFDVIGPVLNPFYCVRFNSAKHIEEKEIVPRMAVFYAPRTEHTSFVFVEQLKRLKGSDASWRHDIEASHKHQEFSDDEEESKLRKAKLDEKRVKQGISDFINGVKATDQPRRAYRPPTQQTQSNNAFYNNINQQQHQQQGSAFFRSNKRYRARDFGPVQWNSSHTQHASAFDTTRPPPMSMPPPTAIPYQSSPAGLSYPPPLFGTPNPFTNPPPMTSPYHSPMTSPGMSFRPPVMFLPTSFSPRSSIFDHPPPPPPQSESYEDLRPPGID